MGLCIFHSILPNVNLSKYLEVMLTNACIIFTIISFCLHSGQHMYKPPIVMQAVVNVEIKVNEWGKDIGQFQTGISKTWRESAIVRCTVQQSEARSSLSVPAPFHRCLKINLFIVWPINFAVKMLLYSERIFYYIRRN